MPYIDFKKLKERVPLVHILAHYDLLTGLKETTQGYEGTCPFCGSDAFKVNIEKNAWFCFGECKDREEKNGGNILDFVMRKEGVAITKAAALIQGWFPEGKQAKNQDDTRAEPKEPRGDAEGKRNAVALVPPE